MITRLVLYIKENLRSIVLGSLFLLVAVSFYNIYQVSMMSPTAQPDNQEQSEELINPAMLDSTSIQTLNYRVLKRLAMDSLIDNNQLTPENIAVIDSMYPDSLCKCGNEYVSLYDSLKVKN